MSSSVNAASPRIHAAVRASAGTGKTWLLIARLIRLLLDDAPPPAILAITFTRKAAAEMQERVLTRLFELTACTGAELDEALEGIGLRPDTALRAKARSLYEALLTAEAPINVTTFHAFCQHILHRFPLEADVPPGFELAENTGLLEEAAWDALFEEATRSPDGSVGRALESLFEYCGGLYGAQSVLGDFLQRRSDWLAYTQGAADPVGHATDRLMKQLDVDPDADPAARMFTEESAALLKEFHELLLRHPIDTHRRHAERIEQALDPGRPPEQRLACLQEAFLRRDGQPLARKASATLGRKLGEAGQARFLELHTQVCAALDETFELQNRLSTFHLSKAWYEAGTNLLERYQAIKSERRQLDFADLEWKAYQLLNQPDHMLWVQYKLDQSVEHILIDEFQDTNPTQWHLIHPLLEQLAEPQAERPRSVFLVGDDKQSIYRFRRAEPRLFDAATEWLKARPNGGMHELYTSYRSAQAIIDFVNRIFGAGPLAGRLPGFTPHQTHRTGLWGRVEILPVIEHVEDDDPCGAEVPGMRDSLERPRADAGVDRHYLEGRQLARRIGALLDEQTLMGEQDVARPLQPSDIVILVRDRTHAAEYEFALRDAGIPYLGISRGSLLSSLEVMDMMALLKTLVAPYDNLSLATVLRCPLFDCSDQDLMRLAAEPQAPGSPVRSWFERLQALAPQVEVGSALQRASHWLPVWREAADRVPVHDLLDRIYCEGDVMARYEAAFPAHLQGRVRANLTRFIELALEIDSGRYPSLSHFLAVLCSLQEQGRNGPDEGPPASLNAVRLMTVHAAKGLEAPVVCLADAAWTKQTPRAYHAMVTWPAEADRPRHFYLTGKRARMDGLSRRLHEADQQADQREEANLLYVALTRPRQVLIVSGCRPSREQGDSWYDLMMQQAAPEGPDDHPWVHESGRQPLHPAAPAPGPAPTVPVDPRLGKPLTANEVATEMAPSEAGRDPEAPENSPGDEDGRLRGIAIHRMLELLTAGTLTAKAAPPRSVAAALGLETGDAEYAAWWREACRVYESPALSHLFDPEGYVAAYNEVPLQYRVRDKRVRGIIDRLVVFDHDVLLIDYKTHANASPDNLGAIAAAYEDAMRLYEAGVRRLWPGKPVRAQLLFTACSTLYDVSRNDRA